MERITKAMLQGMCDRINRQTGAPLEPYTKQEDGTYKANIGNYHLDGAYGGWCIHRMASDGDGVDTPITDGHVSKRELWSLARAYCNGLHDGKSD